MSCFKLQGKERQMTASDFSKIMFYQILVLQVLTGVWGRGRDKTQRI